MSDIWFTSDSHFGHANILTFLDKNGETFRKFSSVEEMDETMIERWNEVVKPGDKIYHLGDVGFGYDRLKEIMPRLQGTKRLILGNHDNVATLIRCGWSPQHIRLWRQFPEHGFSITHVPVAPSSLIKVRFNVHGHIHQNDDPSPQHVNICVEKTDYRPLHLDEVLALIAKKG